MIEKEKIGSVVAGILSDKLFLVDINVSKSNTICIYIDSINDLTIDDCVAVSRYVENNLKDETEDFELQVSSPGVGRPFKVVQQYFKNIGRKIELITSDGLVLSGKLESADDKGLIISPNIKEKSGKNKNREICQSLFFEYRSVKSAKTIVTFNN